MTGKQKYRVNDLVKFYYSEIGEYIGEGYTDKPLRNDEIVDLLNENEQLKQTIKTQNFNYKNAKGIIHSSEHQIQRLEEENKELKQQIKELKSSNEAIKNMGKRKFVIILL